METFNSIIDAERAAAKFFFENFDHRSGVGIQSADGETVEFYSKADPGMDDTFFCQIKDGKLRKASHGGPVLESYTEEWAGIN